ncbi:MAG: hypothetical protein AUJ71_02720 [Candidatus Omnitrophica bacterium CG1_02_49_16]|nr:MAG: hypothetical protein AUJ71_02720 [Candidatus Omnitrophica bacterium CG1_02_49_16]
MKSFMANDREIFEHFIRHENLRTFRVSFDFMLGHPMWWVSYKLNDNIRVFKNALRSSYEIWNDPRIRHFRYSRQVYRAVKQRPKEKRPYLFSAPKDTLNFCVPLVTADRIVGYLGLMGIPKGVRHEILNLFSSHIRLVLENCTQKEDLDRLSATIRPRAIALSTVHTVHRIINSTLNLDELISRLAHLTTQVLRTNRCAIYLFEKTDQLKAGRKRPRRLICKALVGYPKYQKTNFCIPPGTAVEGRVAKTFQIVLRKKIICIPLIDQDIIGVLTVGHKKDKKGFTYFDQEILTTLAEEAVIAIKNAQLYEEQKQVTLGTIQSLAVILGTRMPSISSPEVFLRLALGVAREMRLSEEETQALHYATLLKDTAKIGIPDSILRKPTKLTGEEYRLIRAHPIKGAKIVQSFESLKPVVPIILYSREKYDGTGYPKGLKGEKIPVGARILAVINAFEALIIGRPYRNRASIHEALDEIVKNKGTQFDPKIVDVFVSVVEKDGVGRFLKNAS